MLPPTSWSFRNTDPVVAGIGLKADPDDTGIDRVTFKLACGNSVRYSITTE